MSFEFGCEHRGELKRIAECQLCGMRGRKVEVFECKLHGECTISPAGIRKENKGNLPLLPACISCPNRTSIEKTEAPKEDVPPPRPIIVPTKRIVRPDNWNEAGLFNSNGTAPFSDKPERTTANLKIVGTKRTKRGIKLQVNPLIIERNKKIFYPTVQALANPPTTNCVDRDNDPCCGCCYVYNVCYGNGGTNYTLTGKNRCGIMYVGSAANKFCTNGGMGSLLPAQSIWPNIRTWVRNGGRIVAGTEWDCGSNLCCSASDHALINSFFGAIGSSIVTNSQVAPQLNGPFNQPLLTNVRVTKNVTSIATNATSGVDGGIALANAQAGATYNCGPPTTISAGFPCAAVENINKGSVFCVGDSNFWGYNQQLQTNFLTIAPYV